MKNKNWIDMMKNHGDIRLIEQLATKRLIEKHYSEEDHRSYFLKVTEAGKEELDSLYCYYLEPLYELREKLGNEEFRQLTELIEKANAVLEEKKE